MQIHIHSGRLIDPANNIDQQSDLYVADGRVVGVSYAPENFVPSNTIDATNKIVCPGFIDLCAHFREPGAEQKATIASEAKAAAHSGITTVCCPPNTQPVIDTPAVAELIHQKAEHADGVRIVTLGALTKGLQGAQLSNMAALKEAGCVGVSNALEPIANPLIMRRAMEYAATQDLTIFLHPEDHWLWNNGRMHEGVVSTRLGLPGIPQAAETVAVARDLALIEQTGIRAHFCRLSSARAVQMLARAQYDGLPITADVTAHHLHLSEIDVGDFDSQCHVRPPLRTLRDQEGLRAGVAKGTIGAICSDHQPHEPDAKLEPFSETAPGISALETLLPLSLRLVNDNVIDLPTMISRLTWEPAQILGIEGGRLGTSDRADICIFDPEKFWDLKNNIVSRGHNTPFIGWELQGQVTHTLVAGKIVFQRNP